MSFFFLNGHDVRPRAAAGGGRHDDGTTHTRASGGVESFWGLLFLNSLWSESSFWGGLL